MASKTPKVPNQQILDYIKANLQYDSENGTVSKNGKKIGNIRKNGVVGSSIIYSKENGSQLQCYIAIHQVAWYLVYGIWPDKWIDHIDGNRSNNRLDNLRLATPKQNSGNQRKVSTATTSRYKGVKKVGNKWRAYVGGKHIGYFPTEEEAAKTYDTKAIELYGEFAKCNFGNNCAISNEWVQLSFPWGK